MFEYGVDLDVYGPPAERERDPRRSLLLRAPRRPRRATELGLLALDELAARGGRTRTSSCSATRTRPPAPFPYEFAGVLAAGGSRSSTTSATVGLVISLTNYSLIPKEMMACGLPVVDVRGASAESVFGAQST